MVEDFLAGNEGSSTLKNLVEVRVESELESSEAGRGSKFDREKFAYLHASLVEIREA